MTWPRPTTTPAFRNAEAEVQTVERIANVIEKISILDLHHVVDLLDVRRVRQQLLKFSHLPVSRFVDQLSVSCRVQRGKRGQPGCGLAKKCSAVDRIHSVLLRGELGFTCLRNWVRRRLQAESSG